MKRLEESNCDFSSNLKKSLSQMSPLSLAVVFEQLKRGAKSDI